MRRIPSDGGDSESDGVGSGTGRGVVDGSPGTLTITDGNTVVFEFTSSLGDNQLISSAELFVDGVSAGQMQRDFFDANLWTLRRVATILPHEAASPYVVVHADFETTAANGQEDFLTSAGIRRTRSQTFAPPNYGGSLTVDIADISSTSPTGDHSATIRGRILNDMAFLCISVYDPHGVSVHSESFSIPPRDEDSVIEELTFESTFTNPSGVWGNYSIEAEWFGPRDFASEEPLLIVAGVEPELTALMVYENSYNLAALRFSVADFWKRFPPAHAISNNGNLVSAVGPYSPLKSCLPITQHLAAVLREHQIRLDCWSITSEACLRIGKPVADPRPAFDAGGHAFGNHDMGFMMGHGAISDEVTNPRTGRVHEPSHYMLVGADRETGEGSWLVSSEMTTRFGDGASSKLKWMFLMTCNAFSDGEVKYTGEDGLVQSQSLFNYQQANDLLPIGKGLEILGGYSTFIYLDTELPHKFSEPLDERQPLREAWLNTSQTEAHKSKGYTARTIAWPECNDNTLPGIQNATRNPPLGGDRPQSNLAVRERSGN